MKLSKFSVSVRLPFLDVGGEWEPSEVERKAAWEMYVELVTRISTVELEPNEGVLREALSSLHSLFDITRDILRRYGPAVAKPSREGGLSFGFIAVSVLNKVLRPILATWHPRLMDYENTRPATLSIHEHELAWQHATELRAALEATRHPLLEYASLLGQVAGVPSLLDAS